MPIDFSLLTPQPAPRQGVVGTIAPQPGRPNGLDQLAGGLLEGAKVGTSIAATRQGMAATQQSMDQSAQLFPSQLKEAEDKAATADSVLQQTQATTKSAKDVSDAFHSNWEDGMKQMAKSDPAGYLNLQGTIAKTQESLQATANAAADGKQKSLNMYNQFAMTGYTVAQNAAAAEKSQPGSGEQVYQQQLKMLGPTLSSQLPPHFDSNTFHTLTYVGATAHLDQMKAQENKDATPEMKNAQAVGTLQSKVQNKTITPVEQKTLDSLQSQINDKTNKGKGDKSADDKYQDALASGLAQADAKAVTTASTTRGTLTHLLSDSSDGSAILAKVPPGYTGPIVDWLKANKMDTDVQKLQKITSEIPFLVKSTVGITNGMRFTQGELEQLNRASGDTKINRDALQWVLDRTSTKATEGIHDNWKAENDIRSRGSSDAYKAWVKTNPEPVKDISKDNSYKKVDFQQGKVYTDANGNKATYTGDSKNPWQEVK